MTEAGLPGIDGWALCLTPPGALASPSEWTGTEEWIPAAVPGTAAGALQAAGRWDPALPPEASDVWYRVRLDAVGPARLRFDGLAGIAEIWLDHTRVLRSETMFQAHEIDVDLGQRTGLAICFRSLTAHLARPGKRGRWRPRMAKPSTLAGVRTTLLGHMDGWCPPVPPTGPWRAVTLTLRQAGVHASDIDLHGSFADGVGTLRARLHLAGLQAGDRPALLCAGRRMALSEEGQGCFAATLHLDGIAPWWPHTHGTPSLHSVQLECGDRLLELGRVGFRSITVDRGADGFGFTLACNGQPLFCRGACWTPVDLVRLPQSRDSIAPRLLLMAEAGMNMVRVGGTMLPEGQAFFDLCDEIGILVWHDFMFANFDYPVADPVFRASVETEVTQFLKAHLRAPSLAVVCGGSEVFQQASMMGLPETSWRNALFDEILPDLCARLRPELIYVPNSPSGGVLPFVSNQGVAHYYGVGAYRRPLDDARRAQVRFASECLGFANLPEETTLRSQAAAGDRRHPAWRTNVPRDAGSSYDFADVRDHYLQLLFGCVSDALRETDEDRYLELSRAAIAHAMHSSFSEWRSTRSATAGALVWFLADLDLGSGWGVIDSTGAPKSVWYAMRQTLQPVQVVLTDEGVNGLSAHLINETDTAIAGTLKLTCLRDGAIRVVDGTRRIDLLPRTTLEVPATSLFGAFFDTTYAYRFGPPSHDVVVAELRQAETGEILSQACYFPLGLDPARHALGLQAVVERTGDGWDLLVSTERLAQFVQIEDFGFRAEECWFHLAPGAPLRISLLARAGGETTPKGVVRAVNGEDTVVYQA